MNWYQNKRLKFIRQMLVVYGHINRGNLMRKFGISEQQAALDLRAFNRLYPKRMTYDKKIKRYVAVPRKKGDLLYLHGDFALQDGLGKAARELAVMLKDQK